MNFFFFYINHNRTFSIFYRMICKIILPSRFICKQYSSPVGFDVNIPKSTNNFKNSYDQTCFIVYVFKMKLRIWQ